MVAAQRPRDWAPDRHLSQRAPCVPACVRACGLWVDRSDRMPQRSALGALGALLGFEKVIEATWFFSERILPLSFLRRLYLAPTRRPTDRS